MRAKAANDLSFVVVNIEYRKQLCSCQQVMKAVSQLQQLDFATFVVDRYLPGNEFAQTAGIDMSHTRQVQHDKYFSFVDQSSEGLMQRYSRATDTHSALEIEDRYAVDLPFVD